jgi:hypothetical protein
MNSRNTRHATRFDPELNSQERFNPVLWLVFHAVALWSAAAYWVRFKRICAWHEPSARRMGGNPSRAAAHTASARTVLRASAPRLFPTEKGALALASRRAGTWTGRLFPRPRRAMAPFRHGCNGPLPVTQTRPVRQFSVGKLFN